MYWGDCCRGRNAGDDKLRLVGRYNMEFVRSGEAVKPNPYEVRIEMGVTTKLEGGLHVRLRRVEGLVKLSPLRGT